MAQIRNTAAMTYKGRVGNMTFYVEGGRQLARVAQNSSNYGETARRSEAQQGRRVRWANLVNFYKTSKGWMAKAYETKKRTQSDYNKFMSLNINNARIFLTKQNAAMGACIADEFKISEGSLRSINVVRTSVGWRTDINLGGLDPDQDTTVAEFSTALISGNNYVHEGMQLTFVSYQQSEVVSGVPSVVCTAYEVTIDKTNNDPIFSYIPSFALELSAGCIGASSAISRGCFAYIWSETINGSVRVSSQTLINNNQALINTYSTEVAMRMAIASYGLDADVFLASGSAQTLATPQPNGIISTFVNENLLGDGSVLEVTSDDVLEAVGFTLINEAVVSSITLRSANETYVTLDENYLQSFGTRIEVTQAGITAAKAALGANVFPNSISVTTPAGVYQMDWRVRTAHE